MENGLAAKNTKSVEKTEDRGWWRGIFVLHGSLWLVRSGLCAVGFRTDCGGGRGGGG